MSAAEEAFHNGEVAYEQALRTLRKARDEFEAAGHRFATAETGEGRDAAADAYRVMVRIDATLGDALASRGYEGVG